MKKKKILFHSNHSRVLTGFGKNAKNILKYLAETEKYEIVEVSNGISQGHPDLKKLPWKALGSLPGNKAEIEKLNRDPNLAKAASYGGFMIDQIIKEEKPDIYIGVEDIWAFSGYVKRPWWNKISCMIWTTLDSLPILPEAVSQAADIKNYYVWASFAEKALHKEGHSHVKTLRGSINCDNFKKLSYDDRSGLRSLFNIEKESFIIGFVFRNQLRKSVPNLLEGFKLFKKKNPSSDGKLLLHTSWAEGWDIPRLIKEKDLDAKDIYCTYYCNKCKKYEIKPFTGQKQNCRFCGSKESQNTVTIGDGVGEVQLNEIYNLMDVYCHPFTSGGQEIPIQEANLTELIALVTNYSCGEDSCAKGSGGLPLDWSEYREPGTQFIKASTHPQSISKQLSKVFKMDELKRSSLGKRAREYVVNNYSIDTIGKKLEKIFDEMPLSDWDFNFEKVARDPSYIPISTESDSDWLIDIYKNILKIDLDSSDDGHKYWMDLLEKGSQRSQILEHFKGIAMQENHKNESEKAVPFDHLLDKGKNKRALFVLKETEEDIFLASSLLDSFKASHPDYDVYFACDQQYHHILTSNEHVHKVLPFSKEMQSEFLMIGSSTDNPYFHYYCNLGILTQTHVNYHGIDNKVFNLEYEQA